jgi:uncharacterized protein (TIGR02246 family)
MSVFSLRRLLAAALTLLLTIAATSAARAQSVDEVRAVLDRWAATYGTAANAAEMLPLYHPAAVFWGTTLPQPFVAPDEFAPYFQLQFDNYVRREVTFIDPVIRLVTPDVATATGYARFRVTTTTGQQVEAMLRFTFALIRMEDGWKIIQQHSSQLPQ